MFVKEYSDYIKRAENEIRKKNMDFHIDCTSDRFIIDERLQSLWKKNLLRIANSPQLKNILNGTYLQSELETALAEYFTGISSFKLDNDNCLLLRNKTEAVKSICIGDAPIPIHAPDDIFRYNLDKDIDEKFVLKPEIDTNREPGYFEYKYNAPLMMNSSYVIISNPDTLTGKYYTRSEIKELRDALLQRNSVLIVDAGLGQLLPNLIYTDENPNLIEGVIYIISLSATGLSGNELNLVISNKMIISKIREYTANINKNANFMNSSPLIIQLLINAVYGKELDSYFKNWFKSDTKSRIDIIKNGLIEELSYNYPLLIHQLDGGNSLWLYLKNLPLGDIAVSNLLLSNGAVVNPGSFFFPDKLRNWKHSKECIHININGSKGKETELVEILVKVISKCYSGSANRSTPQ